MRVSGFTFLRNGQQLGFPFIQSIQSALPIVDEFIVNVGDSQDDTLAMVQAIADPKIKIIQSHWNTQMTSKGFVYAQQKMLAQYHCTGDWALYLEADEVLHEQEYAILRAAMQRHLTNKRVEALVFDYIHFYGNSNTYVWSPAWYRRAARLIKTSVRNYAPDGLFWVVLDKSNRKGRYPRAQLAHATIYHYGWVRPQAQMQEKLNQVQQFWSGSNVPVSEINYAAIDSKTLHPFIGVHPKLMQDYFSAENDLFMADPRHILTRRERKNRKGLWLEKWLKLDLSKKHFHLLKGE